MNEHDPELDQDFPEITRRLRALGSAPLLSGVADRTLTRLRSAGRPKLSGTRLKLLSAAAIAGFAARGVGLAAADVLPAPVQDVAHNALDAVGVHVPPGHDRYNDPTVCPGGPYSNHGAYVRSHAGDPNAGKSPCGKPIQSVHPAGKPNADKNDQADKNDKSDGHGPPPWAHGHGKSDQHGPSPSGPHPTTKPAKPSTTGTAPTTTPSTAPITTTSRPAPTTTTTSSTSTTTQP